MSAPAIGSNRVAIDVEATPHGVDLLDYLIRRVETCHIVAYVNALSAGYPHLSLFFSDSVRSVRHPREPSGPCELHNGWISGLAAVRAVATGSKGVGDEGSRRQATPPPQPRRESR